MSKGGVIAMVVAAPVVGLAALVVVVFSVVIDGGSDRASASACAAAGPAVAVQTGQLPDRIGAYSGEQIQNAVSILSIGRQRGLDRHAQQVALIAAMTESGLRDLEGGDRDSAGLFQMRPSQGWGTHDQITDPRYAVGLFYDRLAAVPGWEAKAPGEAAQAVERSAFPDRYATHLPEAAQLMDGLSVSDVARVSTTDRGLACSRSGTTTNGGLDPGERPPTGPHAEQVAKVIAFAKEQLGKSYRLGGAGPDSWDCSGLTKLAYAGIGIDIDDGHSATTQWRNGVARGQMHPLSELQPGDLIFWGGDDAWHVGISLGGELMIAAPKVGDVVKIQKVWGQPNGQVWRPVDGLE
ncbi:C40 family peptidase [Clavibacter michiganensis]|uniref:Peptidoglycan endopeptidase n=1 Tax=Clavibacter michiganensis TaxID=28447 RepID=A0A399NZC5_9MICO|nr:C40 family peptidase [Clavibacter michiganensis]RII99068.1 peptidoglycan endopeptidase [Clavibacter michiganensis]